MKLVKCIVDKYITIDINKVYKCYNDNINKYQIINKDGIKLWLNKTNFIEIGNNKITKVLYEK